MSYICKICETENPNEGTCVKSAMHFAENEYRSEIIIEDMIDLHYNATGVESFLYIVGNGFDLAHGLRTSYENFHQWLQAYTQPTTVRRIEHLYTDVQNEAGQWCDLEKALGQVSLQDAIDYDMNYQDGPDEVMEEPDNAYECGWNLKNVVDVLPGVLKEWAEQIFANSSPLPKFRLHPNAKYFTFNYTKTLENVYGIDNENILHIHGVVGGRNTLEVGFGESIFEEEMIDDIPEDIDIQRIKNILNHRKKPVQAILQEPKTRNWMSSLQNVSKVIVYGSSCSDVDKPYFQTIANHIRDNAVWRYYLYEPSEYQRISSFANYVKRPNQTVLIEHIHGER